MNARLDGSRCRSKDRFSSQRVVLENGTILTGKSIRRISTTRFFTLGGEAVIGGKTIGDVRVDGREIPVFRLRGRGGWRQAGRGITYSADGFNVFAGSWFGDIH